MADEDHGAAFTLDVGHAAEALALELGVADGKDLIDDEDVRLEMGGHREGQSKVHARRVPLDRGVEELSEAGELDDLVEPSR